MRHLALLLSLAACSSSAKQQPAAPLHNQAPADEPAAGLIALDDPRILSALEAHVEADYHSDITTIEHVVFYTRDKRAVRAFYLYAFSGFEEWRGERAAADELDDIVSAMEESQQRCQEEYDATVEEAEAEVQELREIAEESGDPEDEEAYERAEAELVGVHEDGISCSAAQWSDHYPGADVAQACDPDNAVLVAFDIDLDEAGKIELSEVGEDTLSMCGLANESFSETLIAKDFDGDGAPEVLMAWQSTKEYDQFGRGDYDSVLDDISVKVFREDVTVQGEWTSKFHPDPDDDQDVSRRLQSWFEDRNGDRRKDFIHRYTTFEPMCACDDRTFTEQGKIAAWEDSHVDEWTLHQELCGDDAAANNNQAESCAVDSDLEVVQLYDRARDAWRAQN